MIYSQLGRYNNFLHEEGFKKIKEFLKCLLFKANGKFEIDKQSEMYLIVS